MRFPDIEVQVLQSAVKPRITFREIDGEYYIRLNDVVDMFGKIWDKTLPEKRSIVHDFLNVFTELRVWIFATRPERMRAA